MTNTIDFQCIISEASIDTTDEEELVKSSTDTLDDISTAIQATKENELFAVSPLVGGIDKLPPTLPVKRGGGKRSPKASLASPTSPKPESRHRVQFRRQSEYDNVMPAMARLSHTSSSISSSTHTSFDTSSVISSTSSDFQKHVKFDGLDSDDGGDPPPLPLKKKFGKLIFLFLMSVNLIGEICYYCFKQLGVYYFLLQLLGCNMFQ